MIKNSTVIETGVINCYLSVWLATHQLLSLDQCEITTLCLYRMALHHWYLMAVASTFPLQESLQYLITALFCGFRES